MLALLAAILMVIGIFAAHLHTDQFEFWLSWALAAYFAHHAFIGGSITSLLKGK